MTNFSLLHFPIDKHLPPTINFTTVNDTTRPLLRDLGEDVPFMVVVNAFPDVSMFNLTWYKDGQRLELETTHYQIQIFSDSITHISFMISKAKSSDSGVYTLVGNYSASSSLSQMVSASISFTVHISGLPELIIPNAKPFYTVNQSYELQCQSYSFPVSSVWWSWAPCDPAAPASCSYPNLSKNYYADNGTRWRNLSIAEEGNEELEENRAFVQLETSKE